MTLISYDSGTQTATLSTEHTLRTVTNTGDVGEFGLFVDRSAMAAGDVLELRVYKIVLTSGTARLLMPPVVLYGAPSDGKGYEAFIGWIPNDLTDTDAIKFTLKQTLGTGRAYPWKQYRRTDQADVTKWNGTAVLTPDTAGVPKVTVKSGTGTGEVSLSGGKVLLQATQTGVTIPTVTNLTNAPGAGDFTAAMKTSLDAATPAVTVSDKTGFSLSAAGISAIWDQLLSAITTASTIGKLLKDNIDAAISSRTKPADTQAAVTLVATTTNLTNAPSSGDFTSTMKTSLNSATPSLNAAYDAAKTAATQTSVNTIDGIVDAIQAVTDKLDTALEDDGASGFQYTDLALENAPAGGGGGGGDVNVVTVASQAVALDDDGYLMVALRDAAIDASKLQTDPEAPNALVFVTSEEIADDSAEAVWSALLAGNAAVGSFGEAMGALYDAFISTLPEPTVIPAANASLADKLAWMFLMTRNQETQTATAHRLYADDDATVLATRIISTDGTTLTVGKQT